jgi:predicted dehydrogenase
MLDLAIVGAGVMGGSHARVALRTHGVRVAAVVDPDRERGAVLAQKVGADYLASVEQLEDVQAAIVAAPTNRHAALAQVLLERGVDVLVEKPLAGSADEAQTIVDTAQRLGRILAVGHVERFNPPVLSLDQLLDKVIHLDCRRISPFAPRVTDGVVMDLMIHDLDLALALCGPVESVLAQTHSVRADSRGEDIATALLRFASGATAVLTASRVGHEKIRRLQITQPDSALSLDLVRQDVAIHRLEHSEFVSEEGARYRQRGVIEIPYLEQRGEPLALQLAEFVDAVCEQRPPRVDGAQGVAALELVQRVLAAAGG